MAGHRRQVAVLVLSAFVPVLFALAAVRVHAQAPDREDYSVLTDAEGQRYLVPADSDLPDPEFFLPPDTETYGGLLLSGATVQIVQPSTDPAVGSVDGTLLTAVGTPGGGTFSWSAEGPGQATFGGESAMGDLLSLLEEILALGGSSISTTTMVVSAPGVYTVTVEYTVETEAGTLSARNTGGDMGHAGQPGRGRGDGGA